MSFSKLLLKASSSSGLWNTARTRAGCLGSVQRPARASSSSGFPDTYNEAFRQSIDNPEEYWAKIAQEVVWTKPWDKVLDDSDSPFTKWFPGGRLSMCYNAVDRHVDEGFGDDKAIVWDSPVTGNKDTLTWRQLQQQASELAHLLSELGVTKGDRVLIYMPMIPQAIVAMMATIRLGAVHTVVFGGFAAKELSTRIRHCEPKVILSASCGVEPSRVVEYKPLVDEALRLANAPNLPVVVYQRPQLVQAHLDASRGDLNWADEMAKSGRRHDCVDVDANDPLYVLYTSGTTGDPKGIQHPTGGHAVVNKWTMNALYGMNPGEAWWAASDLGWIVGHEYICYSPLLGRNTTVVYEGKPVGTPDANQFFRVIAENNIRGMFTAPTALRVIQKEDQVKPVGQEYDISGLKYLFVAGEHCDHDCRVWAEDKFKVPVLDNWWQTETAHAITASCVGLGNDLNPPKDATGKAVPGFDLKVLRDDGSEAEVGELGQIVCKLPLPPGTMSTLFKAPDRFREAYFKKFKGYYDSMDAGILDEQGYVKVMARVDDVINVAGHRLSTSALEEAVTKHEDVVDCAVIGVKDGVKGEVPLALYVVKPDCAKPTETISKELVALVRENIGPVAAFRLSVPVSGLPRTRSGKTSRKSIADLAAGKQVKIPPTIEDASVFGPIKKALQSIGYAKGAPDPK